MTRALLLALSLTACLSVPEGPKQECKVASDCDTANGEVCDEGLCWGNPPEGTFAAVISPPSDRKDLVSKELSQVVISDAGWLGDLGLEVPVVFSGHLDALCTAPTICDRTKLSATITVTRASQFHGGPGFKAVVASESSPDGPTFEVALPRTNPTDASYIVTVVPDGRGESPSTGGVTAAQIVPPLHLELAALSSLTAQTITLGALDLASIDGQVMSSTGVGLPEHRIVALGHWEASAPATEVSTIDYTGSDGKFRIVLSKDLVGPVEIVAKPYKNPSLPTLHLFNVPSGSSTQRTLVQPAGLGNPTSVMFPVRGLVDGGGSVDPVRGARVRVTASIAPIMVGGVYATFSAEATTDDAGNASIDMLDGATIRDLYKLEVVPPVSSTVGTVFDRSVTLGPQANIMLPSRIALRGVVKDAQGELLSDVQVTARPSLRFTWSLEDKPQAFLSAIPTPSVLTPKSGEFVLFVDPTVAGVFGTYDLVFEPSAKSGAPSWSQGDIAIAQATDVLLPDVVLPDAARVHGMVTDASGLPVEGSEVKLFRIDPSLALCSEVSHAPDTCPIPAKLQGRGDSDDRGLVRLTLPR